MTNSVTHFEIYGEQPAALADFYHEALGWHVEQMPGINYWRIQSLGGSVVRPKTAVPRTAWVTIVADPAKNIFGLWQADPSAFPTPEPD